MSLVLDGNISRIESRSCPIAEAQEWLNVAHVGNSDGHSSSVSANPQACRVSLTRKLVGSRGLATKECKEEQRLGPQHK